MSADEAPTLPAPLHWSSTSFALETCDTLSALPTVHTLRDGVLSLSSSYELGPNTLTYHPDRDGDQNRVFQCGWLLPDAWLREVVLRRERSTAESTGGSAGDAWDWAVTLVASVDTPPDCVYQLSLFACDPATGTWEVVQSTDDVWELTSSATTATFPVDVERLCAAVAGHRNRLASSARGRGRAHAADVTTAYPVCVLGFRRVDMGQHPAAHTLHTETLSLTPYDVRTYATAAAIRHADGKNARFRQRQASARDSSRLAVTGVTQTLTAIRSAEQLAQPFAVLTSEALAPFRWSDQPHFVLQLMVRGTVAGLPVGSQESGLHIVMEPMGGAGAGAGGGSGSGGGDGLAPTLTPVLVADGRFAVSAHTVFATHTDSVHIRFHLAGLATLPADFALDITDLRSTPSLLVDTATLRARGGGAGGGADGSGDGNAVADFASVEQLKREVTELRTATQTLERTPGPPGATGKRGAKGERGEPLRFDDLDHAQKEELRGRRGLSGPQGKPMVFEDLTSEQRALLQGEKGDTGAKGEMGDRGPTGAPGTCFTFDDLSDVQRQLLRGERGLRGEKGEPLTFEELTEAQKAVLRGEKGERGQKGDLGERGERGRVGPTGPIGPEGKQGPRGLPGIPGEKGERGEAGEAGTDGSHGRPAVIKTAFPSIELLRDFVCKSLNLTPNTYYIIDHPTESVDRGEEASGDHGKLFVYTGELDLELTVGCTYVANIQALLSEYNSTVRATVQTDTDEWRLSLTLRSEDICVYQLRRGLENSIVQSGYAVKESLVTDDALQHVGKLCGVQGRAGERGAQGEPGQSLIGMKLDHIGTEATRLKLASPEPNTVFLQVQPSKTHEAGFYLYDGGVWRLLHGVDVESAFLQWMRQFVENPNQESVPLVLSMLSTTQKHMDGQYNTVRQELQEYRTTNEKWKKYQFEHWKSMGNSQYQQFNTQLSEQGQLMESVVQQVSSVADKSVNKDEIGVLRKLLDKQHETLDRKCKALKETLAEFSERQTVDKHVFEQDQDAVQSKLRDIDASTLKMLKIIQYLKTAPWNKPLKQLQQESAQKVFAVRQELQETLGELRELVYGTEQTAKTQHRESEKRFETLEQQQDAVQKALTAHTDTAVQDATSGWRVRLEAAVEKTVKDTDKKLLQTVDALQKERSDKDARVQEGLSDLRAALKETAADVQTADDRWSERFDEQRQKGAAALTHQVDRVRADFAKSLREAETHATDNLAALQHEVKQHHTQQTFDTKTVTKKLGDVETTLGDDIERKTSAAKTYTDEKTRELDQRYANAVQGLATDVQNVDAKCANVDYMLKARLESVEEHIQQLHNEGVQQCETLVGKQHKDAVQMVEKLRDDLTAHQQKSAQTLGDQLQRTDTAALDRHATHEAHLERLDKALLDARKSHEGFVGKCGALDASRAQDMDALKKEVQTHVREVSAKMAAENEALRRQLQETNRELRALVDSRQSDVRTETKQAHAELEDRTTRKYEAHHRALDQQLGQLRTVVEGICTHVDAFAQKEAGYRQQHEARLQQVVGLLEKTFVELRGEQ